MSRGHTVLPVTIQGTNATEGGVEVLLAISRELRESPEEYRLESSRNRRLPHAGRLRRTVMVQTDLRKPQSAKL